MVSVRCSRPLQLKRPSRSCNSSTSWFATSADVVAKLRHRSGGISAEARSGGSAKTD